MIISVCMATYNGEKYILDQIKSVLIQLQGEDELIIVDDKSTDNTVDLIKQLKDKRIKLFVNEKNLGLNKNFEKALAKAEGDIIFLCDQDDVWKEDKIKTFLKYFKETGASVVVSDAYVTNGKLQVIYDSFYAVRGSGQGLIKNFTKSSYLGCCMAFKKELKNIALPFPDKIPMHDIWIGLLGELFGGSYYCKDKLLCYRRHDQTATKIHKKKDFLKILNWRFWLGWELIKRYLKVKTQK